MLVKGSHKERCEKESKGVGFVSLYAYDGEGKRRESEEQSHGDAET